MRRRYNVLWTLSVFPPTENGNNVFVFWKRHTWSLIPPQFPYRIGCVPCKNKKQLYRIINSLPLEWKFRFTKTVFKKGKCLEADWVST
jgi:hypothetical protein